jgi:stalled ribosome rescue protein Dom34
VPNLKKRHSYRRGYPVGVLVGLEEKQAAVWQVFSKVVKPHSIIELNGNDRKALYNFHESIVDTLRPIVREGVRTVVVAAPKTNYCTDFLSHLKKHHSWLVREDGPDSATFGVLIGSASNIQEVSNIVKTKEFHNLLSDATSQDADRIVETLENRLNELGEVATVLYSLEEIEEFINGQSGYENLTPEYVVLTDRYLADAREKSRVNRLLQISKNKNIKTSIVSAETKAGIRISQFGGLICITKAD